jgi:hypothetical protein
VPDLRAQGGTLNVVAIVLSFGRAELGELFTQWMKQTHPTPLLVWLDGYRGRVAAPDAWAPTWVAPRPMIHVHRAPRLGDNHSIGAVRSAAVELARELYSLGPSDGFLVLDDDDYYSPTHAEHTIAALERAPGGWTGADRLAYQWHRDMMPPELVTAGGGPGQHAAWGLRFETYDRAGGYQGADQYEDTTLAARIGWRSFTSHAALTHVRRQFGSTLSSVLKGKSPHVAQYDRDQLRRDNPVPAEITPTWRPELGELEAWTRSHENEPGPHSAETGGCDAL